MSFTAQVMHGGRFYFPTLCVSVLYLSSVLNFGFVLGVFIFVLKGRSNKSIAARCFPGHIESQNFCILLPCWLIFMIFVVLSVIFMKLVQRQVEQQLIIHIFIM